MPDNAVLSKAKQYCEDHGYRFTHPRKEVLEVLLKEKKAMGAYDILPALSTSTYKPNPPTIYRAVEFWIEHGFVHKIMSLNAYIACTHFHKNSLVSFLVCDNCSMVEEVHLHSHLENIDKLKNFYPTYALTEVHGKCAKCNA